MPLPRNAADVENPDSPTPSPRPAPTPEPTSASRLFTPIPSSSPSNSAISENPNPTAAADPSWSTSEPDGPFSSGPVGPSDTPSTSAEKPEGFKLSKAGLRTAVGAGFRQACTLIAVFVATLEERELGVWAPDDEDVDGVARPATNIIYRRLPDEAKGGDVIDLIGLGFAVAGYFGKSAARRAQLRKLQQLQEAAGERGPEAATL